MNTRKISFRSQQQANLNELTPLNFAARDENQGGFHRTERKSSVGVISCRQVLGEVSTNQVDPKSNKKTPAYDIPRPSSIEYSKNPSKQSSSHISASKWLDSDKEMMEFIMNLKGKKSQTKPRMNKKHTEGFQFDDRPDEKEREEYVCNRVLNLKKIEKHEKEAINSFYEKDYEKCFSELLKAETIIKKERMDSPQHMLYINYLYSEFYYKLEQNDKWKSYLTKAKQWITKIPIEAESMKEYIMNVRALDICLALQEEQYDKVLTYAEDLKKGESLSSKIRRRITSAEITAYQKTYKYKDALRVIDEECEALANDAQLNQEKKEQQIGKLLELKIELTAEFVSTEKAIELIESLISFEQVSAGSAESFSYYNLKIYQLFSQLLKKEENSLIKLIFFIEKWMEREPSKKEKLKLELELFRTYYDMGIYERALELFDQISSENVVYLGPDYLFMLANIKHFNREEKEAISILLKVIDIAQDEQARAMYSYRILELDLEEESHQLRCERERALQKLLKNYSGKNSDEILSLYADYLNRRGDYDRASIYANRMRKTANFCEFLSAEDKHERRHIAKK